MPQRLEQLFQKKLTENVSKFKEFLKSCLTLIEDKGVIAKLSTLVKEPHLDA